MKIVQWMFDNPKTVLITLGLITTLYIVYSLYSDVQEEVENFKNMFDSSTNN